MNILEQVYNKRKHPAVYSDENVPTKKEILDIVGKAYPLVTSFRKAFGYQIHILGPNKERSEKIWSICENHKQGIDDEEYGKENAMKFNGDVINDTIVSGSVGLLHIRSAPWTLIATPRVCYPNAYHSDDNTSSGLEETDGKSVWEFADYEHMNTWNRESGALEIAMFLKMIMGNVLQRDYDTGYCVCFPKGKSWKEVWHPVLPELEFWPTVIQTIGKATKYQYEFKSKKSLELDTAPDLNNIINFVDK
jgi:hypothetical protein|tara:strand:+ start:1185 stop:1931 length:747 start_codon:yes stop_codon:yes gene_type:complete